eukprot:CAMPEP_0174361550 /NCGR_PEP_ID=MMETSP0811_2-20130205/59703_1 /TAXON_ID=73025 ORGANISM="Eutreptiella gymnastica-like, Strain CCMP1594" /NCGR_SAMPLE_ID=MMETSP0811_2 /ASSEMBLY_ACC=CAM_ASM_000667 /LENGTH=52 /DNA_ID=CAMNT_0015498281 /DNA_START=121 /DNA_END=275 /DNA_ORIENTATION=+
MDYTQCQSALSKWQGSHPYVTPEFVSGASKVAVDTFFVYSRYWTQKSAPSFA